jgi:hypothetical protein
MTVAYKCNKGFLVGPPRKVQVTWTRGLGGGREEKTVAYKGNKGFGVGPPRKVQVTWNGEKKNLSLDD